eukprot:2906929-Ditylum_brightwellii.AAC.1
MPTHQKGSYVIIAFVLPVIHVLISVYMVAFGHVLNACLEMIGLASFVKNKEEDRDQDEHEDGPAMIVDD